MTAVTNCINLDSADDEREDGKMWEALHPGLMDTKWKDVARRFMQDFQVGPSIDDVMPSCWSMPSGKASRGSCFGSRCYRRRRATIERRLEFHDASLHT